MSRQSIIGTLCLLAMLAGSNAHAVSSWDRVESFEQPVQGVGGLSSAEATASGATDGTGAISGSVSGIQASLVGSSTYASLRFTKQVGVTPAHAGIRVHVPLAGGLILVSAAPTIGEIGASLEVQAFSASCGCSVTRSSTIASLAGPIEGMIEPGDVTMPAFVDLDLLIPEEESGLQAGPIDLTVRVLGNAWCTGACDASFAIDLLGVTATLIDS